MLMQSVFSLDSLSLSLSLLTWVRLPALRRSLFALFRLFRSSGLKCGEWQWYRAMLPKARWYQIHTHSVRWIQSMQLKCCSQINSIRVTRPECSDTRFASSNQPVRYRSIASEYRVWPISWLRRRALQMLWSVLFLLAEFARARVPDLLADRPAAEALRRCASVCFRTFSETFHIRDKEVKRFCCFFFWSASKLELSLSSWRSF